MSLTHAQVLDLLEAYVLAALAPAEADAVTAHLRGCADCRAAYQDMAETVAALAESLAPREPSPDLRERVLAAAAADRARRRVAAAGAWLRRPAFALAAVLLALVAAAGYVLVDDQQQLAAVRAERDELYRIAESMSEGGRWWYMAGLDEFEGSGGTLVAPRRDGRAFVLFHDLRPAPAASYYVVWLIKPDGAWVRAVDFQPTGLPLQRIDLPLQVTDFLQCAVTLELSKWGKRTGPLVMQSRIFQPQ